MIPHLLSIGLRLSFCSNHLLLYSKLLQKLVVLNNDYFIMSLGLCGLMNWGKGSVGWFWSLSLGFSHLAAAAGTGAWSGWGPLRYLSSLYPSFLRSLGASPCGLFTWTSLASSQHGSFRTVGLLAHWLTAPVQVFQWTRQREPHLFWASFGFTIIASYWFWVTDDADSRAGDVDPPFIGWSHILRRVCGMTWFWSSLQKKILPHIHLSYAAKNSSICKCAINSQKLKVAALKSTGFHLKPFCISLPLFSHLHGFSELLPYLLSFIFFPMSCFLILP